MNNPNHNQITRYFTPSNLNLSPTSSQSIPILSMNLETSNQIQIAVTDILNSSDLDSITEKCVRELTSEKIRVNLDDLPSKIFVRQIVESFLLNSNQNAVVPVENGNGGVFVSDVSPDEEQAEIKPVVTDSCRVICKLSQKRDVAVRSSGGKTVVSIREFFLKDGKQILTPKGISLSTDQWSTFRKHIPEIEEVITKVQSRLRHQVEKRPANAGKSENVINQDKRFTIKDLETQLSRPKHGFVDTAKQIGNESSVSSTLHRLVPIEIVRFDGKNYQQWVDHMEAYLNHLKVGYVLSVPRPSSVGVADRELGETLWILEKWTDDDHICRQNILNTLCDSMYSHYSKKTGSARDLWEELKLTYLYEEHGAMVSLVKKYTEFQIVDEKPIFEQVEELHRIADSLIASGMYVEEKFHVNVIISKLPPSWKPFSVDLMKEDYLPVWMLMNELKSEEEYRRNGNKNEVPRPSHASPVYEPVHKLGPQRIPMKRPGILMSNYDVDRERRVRFCGNCKKKGHLSEQCWLRKSSCKDTTVEAGNGVSGVVEGVKDGPARQSAA